MILILSRHGNTFERDEAPRIVGAKEDVPLTSEGEAQARSLGLALDDAGVRLDCLYAGPLRRTVDYAGIAAAASSQYCVVVTDERLRELDFGSWSGLTDSQIAERFGYDVLQAWRKEGRRPEGCGWGPTEDLVRSNIRSLADSLSGMSLCVTSNGILRYALELDPDAFAARSRNGGFRVKTGNICAFLRNREGFRLLFWDERPRSSLFSGPFRA